MDCTPTMKSREKKEARQVDAADDLLPVRMMRPDEAAELARAVYRSYGYSYESPFVYKPEQVAAQIRAGTLQSCVVYNTRGEMVGHFALHFDRPGRRVAEAGLALIGPSPVVPLCVL